MEKESSIKRGVDFATRVGNTATPWRRAFSWWKGEKLNQKTILSISVLWLINLTIIYPMLTRDLSQAYSLSFVITSIADLFSRFLSIPQNYFFWLITFSSLTFAPIGFYLFVRRIAMRHEMTAIIATLIYIFPNPFSGNIPVLANAILKGDGAHVFIISFLPFFMLYVQAFLSTGASPFFFLSAIGISYIALVSPFSAFNLLIFFTVFLLAEGFQGELRIKLIRGLFLLLASALLSFFWYFPTKLIKFLNLSYVQFTISKFLGILPAAIPAIPVGGALAFLIFDRRAKLKPIFISISLLIIYFIFYSVSSQLAIGGILSAERYLPEITLSASLIVAIIFIFLIELFFKRLVVKTQTRFKFFITVLLVVFPTALLLFLALSSIYSAHNFARTEPIRIIYTEGVANVNGLGYWLDYSSIFAAIVSLSTFFFLLYILRKYPIRLQSKIKG